MEGLPRGRKALRNALRVAVAGATLATPLDSQARDAGPQQSKTQVSESVHTKSRAEMTVTPEALDRAIANIEEKFAPGGLWARAFENPATTREEVDRILRYVNQVLPHLEVLQHFSSLYPGQSEALRRKVPPKEYFHGTASVVFHERSREGGTRPRHCGGYYIALDGASFFATAKHCVDGTVEEPQFFSPGYNAGDIALRYEPEYRGPALTLDPTLTDKDIQGKMVALQGERLGEPFMRVSFLIRMSPELYKKIFNESPQANDWLSSQFASTFMMPLQPGDATMNSDGSLPAQGMSGAVVAPWIRGAYRASGPFFGTVHLSAVPPERQVGLSSAKGFVVGVDALKDACNRARALQSAPGWVTRINDER